jgi:hypothetical protein
MKRTIAASAVLLALLALTIACEDSDVTAPEGSIITLDASPATIYIDQAANETQGQTTLFAQIIDAGGLPVSDVPLVFSTDGGLLGSIDNFCADDGECYRGTEDDGSPISCTMNDECFGEDPVTVETNDSGIAQDALLLRLVEDADQVSVTVRGTSLTATETVRKIINLTTPAGSTISLIASPGSVFIDQDAGETEGQTAMVAQVLDNNGAPLARIPLLFTTNGGRLDTVDNYCTSAGQCSRTPADSCSVDGDCVVVAPEVVETDSNGIATDILTLRLIEDPDSVVVTAKGSTLLTTHTVTKTVNLGPADPVASIVADPPLGQRTGLPFQLDGTASTFDPQVNPECYDWSILSNKAVFDATAGVGCVICNLNIPSSCRTQCTDRGPVRSILTLAIGSVGAADLDQDLAVTLRVSDDPSIVCNNTQPVDETKFSQFSDTESYLIRCDLTDPLVEAGPDRFESLAANNGTVELTLTATASDPEDTVLHYDWDCGNGQGQQGADSTVTCTYTTEGTNTAKITVLNDCGRSAQDSLIVQINP